jgi:radical SAM protein with 4Fe4S-binding SPASM domain
MEDNLNNFKKAYIEITNVCNLACDFCPKTQRSPEFMSIELFEKIIHQIKPYTNYVYFHILGEPLLHKNIADFMDICEKENIKVNITTNGTLIKAVGPKIIQKKALRLINFSLHSFEANSQNISMQQYLEDIFDYIDSEANAATMVLRLWNLGNEAIEKNNDILEIIEKKFSLEYKIEEKITPGNGILIRDKLYLQQADRFEWPDINKQKYLNEGFCYGLRNQIGILVDGTVVPCCLDGEGIINLGNIKDVTFKEIIEGKRAKQLYEDFSNRKLSEDLCKTCGYMEKVRNKK